MACLYLLAEAQVLVEVKAVVEWAPEVGIPRVSVI